MAKLLRKLFVFLCALCWTSPVLYAGIADFENFASEGSLGTSFLDPASGILFSNATTVGHNFVIEYGGADENRPLTSPGNILSSNGYAPGPGISATPNFGFRGLLPTPAYRVSIDVISSITTASLRVIGLDEADNELTETTTPLLGSWKDQTITIQSTEAIHAFRVDASHSTYTGYDNIRFTPVPEPAVSTMILSGIALTLSQRINR